MRKKRYWGCCLPICVTGFFFRFAIVLLLLLDKSNELLELAALEWISYINPCRWASPAYFRKRAQIAFSESVLRINDQCAFQCRLRLVVAFLHHQGYPQVAPGLW